MTSSGLKRPIDFELPQQNTVSDASQSPGSGSNENSSNNTNNNNNITNTNNNNNATLSNGNKRRCTSTFTPLASHASQMDQYLSLTNKQTMTQQQVTDCSPFTDLPGIHDTLQDEISNLIKEEISRATHESSLSKADELSSLSARQLQAICEKIIKDKEQRIRHEYDKVLTCKLAEQYDLLTKTNYINPYVGPSSRQIPPPPPPPPAPSVAGNAPAASAVAAATAASVHLQARNHHQPHHHHRHSAALTAAANHQSILAAAFSSMQRSGMSSPPVSSQTSQSLPNLASLAASLSANAHPGAITSQLAYNLQHQAAAAANYSQQQRPLSATGPIPSGPVLLTSNLDEQLATPEALFTLFGVFGDVIRVKILFNKKDNALIQMADANQAQVAQSYLDKQKVFGKQIRVTRSKHQSVQMPRDGNQSDAGLTKDFTNSALHRFKFPGSRNYLNIYPPSNTLHISNIPATIDDSYLQKAFKDQCGFEFSSFKFFPKDKKMALMRFSTVEQATIALIKMHNFQISDGNNLRVSFSKSVMQP